MLLYVQRKRRLIRDGSPGQPPWLTQLLRSAVIFFVLFFLFFSLHWYPRSRLNSTVFLVLLCLDWIQQRNLNHQGRQLLKQNEQCWTYNYTWCTVLICMHISSLSTARLLAFVVSILPCNILLFLATVSVGPLNTFRPVVDKQWE